MVSYSCCLLHAALPKIAFQFATVMTTAANHVLIIRKAGLQMSDSMYADDDAH